MRKRFLSLLLMASACLSVMAGAAENPKLDITDYNGQTLYITENGFFLVTLTGKHPADEDAIAAATLSKFSGEMTVLGSAADSRIVIEALPEGGSLLLKNLSVESLYVESDVTVGTEGFVVFDVKKDYGVYSKNSSSLTFNGTADIDIKTSAVSSPMINSLSNLTFNNSGHVEVSATNHAMAFNNIGSLKFNGNSSVNIAMSESFAPVIVGADSNSTVAFTGIKGDITIASGYSVATSGLASITATCEGDFVCTDNSSSPFFTCQIDVEAEGDFTANIGNILLSSRSGSESCSIKANNVSIESAVSGSTVIQDKLEIVAQEDVEFNVKKGGNITTGSGVKISCVNFTAESAGNSPAFTGANIKIDATGTVKLINTSDAGNFSCNNVEITCDSFSLSNTCNGAAIMCPKFKITAAKDIEFEFSSSAYIGGPLTAECHNFSISSASSSPLFMGDTSIELDGGDVQITNNGHMVTKNKLNINGANNVFIESEKTSNLPTFDAPVTINNTGDLVISEKSSYLFIFNNNVDITSGSVSIQSKGGITSARGMNIHSQGDIMITGVASEQEYPASACGAHSLTTENGNITYITGLDTDDEADLIWPFNEKSVIDKDLFSYISWGNGFVSRYGTKKTATYSFSNNSSCAPLLYIAIDQENPENIDEEGEVIANIVDITDNNNYICKSLEVNPYYYVARGFTAEKAISTGIDGSNGWEAAYLPFLPTNVSGLTTYQVVRYDKEKPSVDVYLNESVKANSVVIYESGDEAYEFSAENVKVFATAISETDKTGAELVAAGAEVNITTEIPTSVESPVEGESENIVKTIENGKIVIIKNGEKFDVTGRKL